MVSVERYWLLFILGTVGLDIEDVLLPLLTNINIPNIKINDGILLALIMRPKKLILRLRLDPPIRLYRPIVEIRRTDIGIALMPPSEMLLQEQVVSRRDMVMLVSLDAPRAVLQIEAEFGQFGQDLGINGHPMVADHDAAV